MTRARCGGYDVSARPALDEILQLRPDQRLQLTEDIWDSIPA
jgi:hypothetical protein